MSEPIDTVNRSTTREAREIATVVDLIQDIALP